MSGSQWRQTALCHDMDPELFFNPEHQATGLMVCRHCPVKKECLLEALRNPRINGYPLEGIWGGTTQDARRKILNKNKRKTR